VAKNCELQTESSVTYFKKSSHTSLSSAGESATELSEHETDICKQHIQHVT
jgi:hypothetical protein